MASPISEPKQLATFTLLEEGKGSDPVRNGSGGVVTSLDQKADRATVESADHLDRLKIYTVCGKYYSELQLTDGEYATIEKTHNEALKVIKESNKDKDEYKDFNFDKAKISSVDYKFGILKLEIDGKVQDFCLEGKLSIFNPVKEIIVKKTGGRIRDFTAYESVNSKCPNIGAPAFMKDEYTSAIKKAKSDIECSPKTLSGKAKRIWNGVTGQRKKAKKSFEEFQTNMNKSLGRLRNGASIEDASKEGIEFSNRFDKRAEEFRIEYEKQLEDEHSKNETALETSKVPMRVIQGEIDTLKAEIAVLKEDPAKADQLSAKEADLTTKQQELANLTGNKEYLKLQAKENLLHQLQDEVKNLDFFALKMVTAMKLRNGVKGVILDDKVAESLEFAHEMMQVLKVHKSSFSSDGKKLTDSEKKYCGYAATMLLDGREEASAFANRFQSKYGIALDPAQESFEERSKFSEIYSSSDEDVTVKIQEAIEAECKRAEYS